jgi:hypothetical protein
MKSANKTIMMLVFALVCTGAFVTTAYADAVSDWNTLVYQTSAGNVPARAPHQSTRIAAMTHIAIHDALNAVDSRYEQYAYNGSGGAGASPTAAIAAAAYNVLRVENPTQAAVLLAAYNNSLAAVPDGPAKTAGITIGEAAAAAILANRTNDGSATAACAHTPGTGAGEWRPTPPAFAPFALACWGAVKPFTMPRGDRWRPASQPYFHLNMRTYTREFNEVKEFGGVGSTSRTTDQSEAARFWYPNPPLTWGRIAGIVAAQRGLDLWESARLYALLSAAQADALIASQDSKLAYLFWRPVTAIREADTDGNPNTEADPTWTSYMITPPYPDFTSAHAAVDGAAAEVFVRFFRTDTASFSLATTLPPNPPLTRSFTSFTGAAQDGAESRIWGGIHFRSACEDGLWQGESVGRQAFNHYFRPVEGRGFSILMFYERP